MITATAEQQLKFLRNLQTILDAGQFVASYKFALLIALADISLERKPDEDGSLSISLEDLSERFIEVYWRQSAPFRGREQLWQNSGSQAAVISAIARIRGNARSLSKARKSAEWNQLLRRVRTILLDQPLWRLQRVGPTILGCFYDHQLNDDAITLKPGVSMCFRLLHDTVQAIVQLAWLRYVQNLPRNQSLIGSGHDVSAFLFGADRNVLSQINDGLAELQKGQCFYCQSALRGQSEVDHFIPWARYPRDLGHNFVLAHRACNNSKSDLLADVPYLERWANRNAAHRDPLSDLFNRFQLQHDVNTSIHVAEWCYSSVEESRGLVWSNKNEFVLLNEKWRSALGVNA